MNSTLRYFNGNGVEKNVSESLLYFERSVETGRGSADSFYNAGHIHYELNRNMTAAYRYWNEAASQFGHFDAIVAMGTLYDGFSFWREYDVSLLRHHT